MARDARELEDVGLQGLVHRQPDEGILDYVEVHRGPDPALELDDDGVRDVVVARPPALIDPHPIGREAGVRGFVDVDDRFVEEDVLRAALAADLTVERRQAPAVLGVVLPDVAVGRLEQDLRIDVPDEGGIQADRYRDELDLERIALAGAAEAGDGNGHGRIALVADDDISFAAGGDLEGEEALRI